MGNGNEKTMISTNNNNEEDNNDNKNDSNNNNKSYQYRISNKFGENNLNLQDKKFLNEYLKSRMKFNVSEIIEISM